jgi:hypothetical protein
MCLAMTMYACTDSNFAGSGSKKSLNLTGGKDGNDGPGGNDAPDGAPDSGSPGTATAGNDGPDGNATAGNDGPDGNGTGGVDTADGNGTGGIDTDDGNGGNDAPDDGGNDDGGPGLDDGSETSLKLRHDGTLSYADRDDSHTIKIETIIKGNVVATFTKAVDDEEKGPFTLTAACRNKRETCLRVTVTGEETQVVGASACTSITGGAGSPAVSIHADSNGAGPIGSCLGGAAEALSIT